MATTFLQMFLGNPKPGEVHFHSLRQVFCGKKKKKKNPQRLFI